MLIAAIIQSVIFILYMILIYSKFGVIDSISDSWYLLPKKLKLLFTFMCWGIGLPMVAHINPDIAGAGLWFLSAAGFGFTGAATMFKSKGAHANIVHYAGAAAGMIGALIALGVQYGLWILSYIGFPLAILIFIFGYLGKGKYEIKYPMYWVEILAAILILIGLFII